MNFKNLFAYLIVLIAIYQLAIFTYYFFKAFYKHFLVQELDLSKRYGKGSYVIITGPSSGQGKHFAYEFAKRGFNLILIGSERTNIVSKDLQNKYKNIKIITIVKNFCDATERDFFDEIKEAINRVGGNISILVNNVGHRSAWNPYHEMPTDMITNTIIVGTVVQSQLTRICLPYFLKRKQKNCVMNITSQCIFPTFGFGEILDNHITVPYLSVYEAANAFGFYQANSVWEEYKKYDNIEFLNIMPGAVVTENTKNLSNTIFNIEADKFVKNIMRLLGNFTGNSYAHWGHALSVPLVNLAPFIKNMILKDVGLNISNNYMNTPCKKY
jgi:short-subunit dehydrogenase